MAVLAKVEDGRDEGEGHEGQGQALDLATSHGSFSNQQNFNLPKLPHLEKKTSSARNNFFGSTFNCILKYFLFHFEKICFASAIPGKTHFHWQTDGIAGFNRIFSFVFSLSSHKKTFAAANGVSQRKRRFGSGRRELFATFSTTRRVVRRRRRVAASKASWGPQDSSKPLQPIRSSEPLSLELKTILGPTGSIPLNLHFQLCLLGLFLSH